MSFKTVTTFQYILPCKQLSYELEERVRKYLKGAKEVNAVVGHEDDDSYPRSLVITSKTPIPLYKLEFIENAIPNMIKDIKDCEQRSAKYDLNTVARFLQTYEIPTVSGVRHIHELDMLQTVIANRLMDIKQDYYTKREGNVCYMGDVKAWTKMFNCIKHNKLRDAYSVYRSLDTGEREITPECVRDLIEGMS